MRNVKVLGTGCTNCKTTLKLIEEVAAEKGVAVQLEKVEDIQAIMGYGVMSTPAVVIDGTKCLRMCPSLEASQPELFRGVLSFADHYDLRVHGIQTEPELAKAS